MSPIGVGDHPPKHILDDGLGFTIVQMAPIHIEHNGTRTQFGNRFIARDDQAVTGWAEQAQRKLDVQ